MSNDLVIVEIFDKFTPNKLQCSYSKCLWLDSNEKKLVQFDVIGKSLTYFNIPKDLLDYKLFIGIENNENDVVIPSNPDQMELLENNILEWSQPKISQNLTYDIHVKIGSKETFYKNVYGSKLNFNELMKDLKPYTPIEISLRAQTPWAKSKNILSKIFHTPMGIPTAPRHLRVYK